MSGRRTSRHASRWLACALAACLAPAAAQDYLPPSELVPGALQQHPELRAARARIDAARAQARALALGEHGLEASFSPLRRRTDSEGDFDEWELEIARGIRLPAKARLDRELGQLTLREAELDARTAHRDAAQRLLLHWMTWLRASADADLQAQQQALVQASRDSLARRVAVGDAAQLELDLLEAELAALQAARLRGDADRDRARRMLASEFPQLPLPQRAPTMPTPESLWDEVGIDAAGADTAGSTDWAHRLRAQSPEREAARSGADRLALAAARARAERRPDPSIGLRLLDERNGQERSVGVVVNVPLGSRHLRARAHSAEAEAIAGQETARAQLIAIERDIDEAIAEAASTFAQWRAQQAALTAAEAVARRTLRAWELGEIALHERLLAERSQRSAAHEERIARGNALQSSLRLRIDDGMLWPMAMD